MVRDDNNYIKEIPEMRHPRGIINAGAHSSLLRKLSYNIPVVSERVAFTSSRIVFF